MKILGHILSNKVKQIYTKSSKTLICLLPFLSFFLKGRARKLVPRIIRKKHLSPFSNFPLPNPRAFFFLDSIMPSRVAVINPTTLSFAAVLVMTAAIITASAAGGDFSDLHEVKVRGHLKKLNRPALKSIKSPDGDVIDCVPISQQPAFEHPLLKSHTIQMKPSFHPEDVYSGSKVSSNTTKQSKVILSQLWHVNGKCPENTVPIRRTRREDFIRANSIENYGKKNQKSIPKPKSYDPASVLTQNGHQHAIMYVEDGKFYGAKAKMNVWKPDVEMPNEFSLGQIWVLGGNFNSDLNSIEAGWQVSPQLYGDNNTRLFTYWTSDAYQGTGCYNLLCSGFVQINNEIAMGGSIAPLSNYGGSQYDITILIWKDQKEGNWWLQFGEKYVIGYWPGSLFSYLSESASMIEWGGEVVNSEDEGRHTRTQMGSGHFAEEGWAKASYFKNVQIVDGSNTLRDPDGLQVFTEQESCYNVKSGSGGSWGSFFYYGGPGRNPDCP